MSRMKLLKLVSACGLSVCLAVGTTAAYADLKSDAKYSIQINGSNFKSANFGIPSQYSMNDFISSKYVYEDFNSWSTSRAGNVSSDSYDPTTSTKGGILAEVDSRVKTDISKLGDYTSMTEGQVLPNLMSVKAKSYNDRVQVGWFGSADDGYYGFKGNNVNGGVKNPIESSPGYYLSYSLMGVNNAASADESKKMPYYSTLDNYLNVGDWNSFNGTIVVSYDYLVTLSRGYASGGQIMLRNYGIASNGAIRSTFLTGLPAVWYDSGYSSIRTTAHGGINVTEGAASTKVNDQGKINLVGANEELANVSQGDWVHVTVAITRDAATGKLTQREYINGLPIAGESGSTELVIDAKKVTDSYDVLGQTGDNYCGIGLNIETSYTDGKWGGIDNICYKVYYGSELGETAIPASKLTGKGETRSVSVPFEAKLNLTDDEKALAPSGATQGYVDLSKATVSVKKCEADDYLMLGSPVSGASIDYTTKSDRAMTYWGTDGTNVVTPTQKKGYDGSFIRVSGLPVLESGENLVVTYENGVDMLGNTVSGSFTVYSGSEAVSFTDTKFYNYFGDDVTAELKDGKYNISSDATKLVIDSGVSDKNISLKDGVKTIATAVYNSTDKQYVLSLDVGKTLAKNTEYDLYVDGAKKTTLVTGGGSFAYRGDASESKVDYLNTTKDSVDAMVCLVDAANGTNLAAQDTTFSAESVGTVNIMGSVTATNKNVLVLPIPDEDDVKNDVNALNVKTFDTANKTEIAGSLGEGMANKDIEIFAFAGGFNTEYASKLKWAAKTKTDAKGDYKVTADFTSLSTADFDFVMTDGTNVYLTSKAYGKYTDTQNAIELLNAATDSQGLLQVIKNKRCDLEFDYELFDKYESNQSKTAQHLFAYIKAEKDKGNVGLATNDKATAVKLFKQFAIMSAFSTSTVADIEKIDGDILDIQKPLIDKWYNDTEGTIGKTRLASWHTSIRDALSGATFEDIADFNKKFEVSLAFAIVKNPETSDSLKTFLTDISGSDYMNISTDLITTKAVKTISGKSYTGFTYKPLTDDIKANAETNKYQGGGNGGGGGGGSYATVTTEDDNLPKDDDANKTDDVSGDNSGNDKVYLFADMKDADWANEAVEKLAQKGIISGKSDGVFEPNSLITREEFAKLAVELASVEVEHGDFPFADVPEDDWCYRYVKAAYKNGIVNGISDDCFGIGMNITRQDLAVMLTNAMKLRGLTMTEAEVTFTDADEISDYAKSAVGVLVNAGAIGGYDDGSFKPNECATRAEAAKIIYAVLDMFE